MKTTKGISVGETKVTLCGLPANAIECDGRIWVPDAATAYVEFFIAHSFPTFVDCGNPGQRAPFTTLHPAVIARSYRSLIGKPVNLGHLMVSNDPGTILQDRILGTVMAAEFPEMPPGGWVVQGNLANASGIRVVAALHKNAQGVPLILKTWDEGRTLFTDTPWTVSMENQATVAQGGFLVQRTKRVDKMLEAWILTTPPDFAVLDWIYVPYGEAAADLRACIADGEYMGLKSDYLGARTLYLNGGLDGQLFFFGVALVPAGKESSARVVRMFAGQRVPDIGAAFNAIAELAQQLTKS